MGGWFMTLISFKCFEKPFLILAEYNICFLLFRSKLLLCLQVHSWTRKSSCKCPLGWDEVSVVVLHIKNFTPNIESHCQLTNAEIISFFFFFFLTSETSQSWQMLMQTLWHQHDLASSQPLHLHNYSQAFLNTFFLTACFGLGLLLFCAVFPHLSLFNHQTLMAGIIFQVLFWRVSWS